MFYKKNKKANILMENIIFIVLNLVFLSILILFLFSNIGNVAVLEEKYSKQIALIIDSSKPKMEISINMEDAFEESKDEWGEEKIDEVIKKYGELIVINENIVTVKLKDGKGYSYSFFNDVKADAYYAQDNKQYIITINEK
jgi:hypothetical protein